MKTALHFILGFATACVLIVSLQWHFKPQVERDVISMQSICSASFQMIDGDLERACGEMIDVVENYGFEVMSKNGTFWVED